LPPPVMNDSLELLVIGVVTAAVTLAASWLWIRFALWRQNRSARRKAGAD